MLRRALAVVMLSVLCVPVAGPQQPDEKISIHISDTLVNIIRLLSREHSLAINTTKELADAFVELDLENASPLEVVTAICKQVGAVYDCHEGRGRFWAVRPGDWDTDCRPRVELDDYTVLVESAEIHHSRSLKFRWGHDEAEPGDTAGLEIRLRVKPKTETARMKLAGIWREASTLTPKGEVVETTFRAFTDYPAEMQFNIGPMEPYSTRLDFPSPPEGVQLLKELRGKLLLFREVVPAHCEFTAQELGMTKILGDDDCKLVKWQEVEEEIVIAFERPSTGWEPLGDPSLKASLLGAGGEQARRSGWGTKGGKIQTKTWRFTKPEWEVEKFVIEGFIRRDAEDFVEFVIREIPLP